MAKQVAIPLLFQGSSAFMDEFYTNWIDVEIFEESGEPLLLCKIMVFLREMALYWRAILIVTILLDRCIYMSGKASIKRLLISSFIVSFVTMLMAGGLAGYWIDQVYI